jgi:hypothetical protein
MQSEPIHFDTMTMARANRTATGPSLGRSTRKLLADLSIAKVLDAAFADYTRVDAGSPASESRAAQSPTRLQTATRELIADISIQLATLDQQRRQLVHLLESAETV